VEKTPGLEVVPLGWCIEAMNRAFERVRSTGWNDPVGAYAAVAETLFWIDIVDEQHRKKYRQHYEATLAEQHDDVGRMVCGLLFARNRITHEVDEIGYIIGKTKRPDSFSATWMWQSLPPRPGEKQATLHRDYQETIAGRDVVETLLTVTVFLGAARNRMWQHYREEHAKCPAAAPMGSTRPHTAVHWPPTG
jgi:hypothetical protein